MDTNIKKVKSNKIESLMGLRFIFALGIFFHHFDTFSDLQIPNYYTYSKYWFEGFVGVNFFFILSGFIIAYCYTNKLKEGTIGHGEFLYKRFARVWPVHVLTFIIAAINYSSIKDIFSKSGIITLAMFQSYIPIEGYAFNFNGVSWSLSTEMFFYVSFCFLVFLPKVHLKGLFTILLGLNLICLFVGGESLPTGTWTFYINPFFRLVDFIAGMLVFEIYKIKKDKISSSTATYLEIGSVVLLLFMMYVGTTNVISIYGRFDLYYLVPISFLLFSFALNKGILSRILGNRVFVFLGECSFAFYMIHQIILVKFKQLFGSHINNISTMFIWGVLALGVTLILSIAIFYIYERSLNSMLIKIRGYALTEYKKTKGKA